MHHSDQVTLTLKRSFKNRASCQSFWAGAGVGGSVKAEPGALDRAGKSGDVPMMGRLCLWYLAVCVY